MKRVTLSPTQLMLVRDDIASTLEYLDIQLTGEGEPEPGCKWTAEEREQAVHEAQECRQLLKQLEEFA